MTKNQHMWIIQCIYIHLGKLLLRGASCPLLAMNTSNRIIAGTQNMLTKNMGLTELIAIYSLVKGNIIGKQIALKVNNINLSAVKQPYSMPGLWPNSSVHKELEVFDSLLVIQHG